MVYADDMFSWPSIGHNQYLLNIFIRGALACNDSIQNNIQISFYWHVFVYMIRGNVCYLVTSLVTYISKWLLVSNQYKIRCWARFNAYIDNIIRLFICVLYVSEGLYIIQARGKVVKAYVEAFMTFTWLYEMFVLLGNKSGWVCLECIYKLAI